MNRRDFFKLLAGGTVAIFLPKRAKSEPTDEELCRQAEKLINWQWKNPSWPLNNDESCWKKCAVGVDWKIEDSCTIENASGDDWDISFTPTNEYYAITDIDSNTFYTTFYPSGNRWYYTWNGKIYERTVIIEKNEPPNTTTRA